MLLYFYKLFGPTIRSPNKSIQTYPVCFDTIIYRISSLCSQRISRLKIKMFKFLKIKNFYSKWNITFSYFQGHALWSYYHSYSSSSMFIGWLFFDLLLEIIFFSPFFLCCFFRNFYCCIWFLFLTSSALKTSSLKWAIFSSRSSMRGFSSFFWDFLS